MTATLIDTTPVTFTWTARTESVVLNGHYPQLTGAERRALLAFAENIDGGRCAVCDRPGGFLLSGDADENCDWHPVVVVTSHGGIVRIVCEGCAPDA